MFYNDYSIFTQRLELDLTEGRVPSEILIRNILTLHASDRIKMEKLYARYSARVDGAPIRKRVIQPEGKANNKIENNFFKKIVDAKVGYYASKIDYQIDKNDYIENEINDNSDILQEFLIKSNSKKLDSNIAKMAGICGYGVKNLYIVGGELFSQSIFPWECVFISDTERPKYCVRYYTIAEITEQGVVNKLQIDFYDDRNIYSYVENGDKGNVSIGGHYDYIGTRPHYLNGLPMIQFKNNSELSPDCDESVLSLIDAYNTCLSDSVNEIDGLAQAYLVLVNMVLGNNSEEAKNTLEEMKQAGVIQVGDNGQAFFITKNINDTFFENILNRIEQNIYTFASSVNMNDQNFANNTSGVAMKYKLLALETVSIISENEFKAATLEMFRIASGFWALRNIEIDYTDIFINMKRNFPLDIQSEAQANSLLKGLVSEETRLSQLSFVDDVQYEIKLMEEEAQSSNTPYNLDSNPTDQNAMDNNSGMPGEMTDSQDTTEGQ